MDKTTTLIIEEIGKEMAKLRQSINTLENNVDVLNEKTDILVNELSCLTVRFENFIEE